MSGTRIDITDLLTRSVLKREAVLDCEIPGLAVSAARIGIPVKADLVLTRIPEGIVVRGTFSCSWMAQCSYCLEDIEGPLSADVDELFEEGAVEGETYSIDSNEIDLDQLIRDTLVVELPLAPACGTSTCTNFPSEVVESGDTSSGLRDLRWGALSELEF